MRSAEIRLDRMERRRSRICDNPLGAFSECYCSEKNCADFCVGIEFLRRELSLKLYEYLDAVMLCHTMLNALKDPIHVQLLKMHYVDGLGWRKISEEMHYSMSFCMKHRRKAIDQLCELLKDTETSPVKRRIRRNMCS